MRDSCDLSEIPQLYPAFPHLVVEGVGTWSIIDPEGRLRSFTMRHLGYGLRRMVLLGTRVNKVGLASRSYRMAKGPGRSQVARSTAQVDQLIFEEHEIALVSVAAQLLVVPQGIRR